MDKHSAGTGVPVSVARRRLKMLMCTVLGISVLSMMGGGGYLAFKKVAVSKYDKKCSSTGYILFSFNISHDNDKKVKC